MFCSYDMTAMKHSVGVATAQLSGLFLEHINLAEVSPNFSSIKSFPHGMFLFVLHV